MDTLFYGKVTDVALVKQGDHRGALLRMSAGWGGRSEAGAAGLQGAHRVVRQRSSMVLVLLLQQDEDTCAADFNPDIFVGKHPPVKGSISPEALRKCLRCPPDLCSPFCSGRPVQLRLCFGGERFLKESSGRSVFNH